MTTLDFITALFCGVDDLMSGVAKHLQARLYPTLIALNCSTRGAKVTVRGP
jgi:hypothetical protein